MSQFIVGPIHRSNSIGYPVGYVTLPRFLQAYKSRSFDAEGVYIVYTFSRKPIVPQGTNFFLLVEEYGAMGLTSLRPVRPLRAEPATRLQCTVYVSAIAHAVGRTSAFSAWPWPSGYCIIAI